MGSPARNFRGSFFESQETHDSHQHRLRSQQHRPVIITSSYHPITSHITPQYHTSQHHSLTTTFIAISIINFIHIIIRTLIIIILIVIYHIIIIHVNIVSPVLIYAPTNFNIVGFWCVLQEVGRIAQPLSNPHIFSYPLHINIKFMYKYLIMYYRTLTRFWPPPTPFLAPLHQGRLLESGRNGQ